MALAFPPLDFILSIQKHIDLPPILFTFRTLIQHLILCHSFLLLPSVFPSTRVFSNESALCIKWPKYWSFSFNISPSNEYPGLISFRMDYGSPCTLRDSLESSPTSQFKSVNTLVLSFLYNPTLTSIHDHWENHSLD